MNHPRHLTLLLLGLVCLNQSLSGQNPAQTPQERFTVDIDLALLRFALRDTAGRFVNSLKQDDFRILHNGVPQEIQYFEAPRRQGPPRGRLWLAFLLDVSGSTFATRAEEIVAARSFLDNITRSTVTGVFGFTDKLITFANFTTNRELALLGFRDARRHLGKTAIYDSLQQLMSLMSTRAGPDERKAIIIISDGLDDSFAKSAASAARAKETGTTLYTILVPSVAQVYIGPDSSFADSTTANRADPQQAAKENAFNSLSLGTGGMSFEGFKAILNVDDVLAQINDHLFGNLYSIAYYPEGVSFETTIQDVEILPHDPSLEVSSAFEQMPPRFAHKKSLLAALFDHEALVKLADENWRAFREIGAQMDILAARREGGRLGLPFRLKINPLSFPEASKRGVYTQLGIIGLLSDLSGNEVVRLREIFQVRLGAKQVRQGRGIIYTNKLFAPPGQYKLRVVIVEIATWRLTSFLALVRVGPSGQRGWSDPFPLARDTALQHRKHRSGAQAGRSGRPPR